MNFHWLQILSPQLIHSNFNDIAYFDGIHTNKISQIESVYQAILRAMQYIDGAIYTISKWEFMVKNENIDVFLFLFFFIIMMRSILFYTSCSHRQNKIKNYLKWILVRISTSIHKGKINLWRSLSRWNFWFFNVLLLIRKSNKIKLSYRLKSWKANILKKYSSIEDKSFVNTINSFAFNF